MGTLPFAPVSILAVLLLALACPSAWALPWPEDSGGSWYATSISDPPTDRQQPPEVAGDSTYPALYWFGDDTYICFRLRVDREPGPTGPGNPPPVPGTFYYSFDNYVWTIALETDNRDGKNLLDWGLSVDGKKRDAVDLQPRGATDIPLFAPQPYTWPSGNWFGDPDIIVAYLPAPLHARWTLATDGSNFNNDSDFFVDVAITRSQLTNAVRAGLPNNNPPIPAYPDWDGRFRISFCTSADDNNVNKDTPQTGTPWWPAVPFNFLAVPDYGDLPDVYKTLIASGGPVHQDGTYEWLGLLRDTESNGIPSAWADGDDHHGLDDEDGVVFDFINGKYVVTISVLNHQDNIRYETGNPAKQLFLNGFIDANADGDFADPSETLATVAFDPLTWSTNTYMYEVGFHWPAGVPGIFSRWRLSYGTGGVGPGGSTGFGEVEDYYHVPEPTSLTLLALGGLALLRRRRRAR